MQSEDGKVLEITKGRYNMLFPWLKIILPVLQYCLTDLKVTFWNPELQMKVDGLF